MASRNLLPSAIARIVDFMVFLLCGITSLYFYEYIFSADLDFQRYFSLVVFGGFAFVLLNNQLYRSWRSEGFFKLIQTVGAVVAKTWILVIFGLLFSKTNDLFSRLWIVMWVGFTFFGLLFVRYLSHIYLGRLRSKGINLKHVVIIGSGTTAKELKGRIARSPWAGFNVGKYIAEPSDSELKKIAEEPYDEIWLALDMSEQHQISLIMDCLKNSTANVRFVPDWFSYRLINHGVSEVLGIEMVDLYGSPMSGSNLLVKNIEDFVISLLAVILLSPLFLLLAIAVKLSSQARFFIAKLV